MNLQKENGKSEASAAQINTSAVVGGGRFLFWELWTDLSCLSFSFSIVKLVTVIFCSRQRNVVKFN